MSTNFVYLYENNSLTNLTDFDLSVNKLTVDKRTKLNQNLNVIGNTIISKNLNVTNTIITPNLIVLQNLNISGVSTFKQNINIESNLNIS